MRKVIWVVSLIAFCLAAPIQAPTQVPSTRDYVVWGAGGAAAGAVVGLVLSFALFGDATFVVTDTLVGSLVGAGIGLSVPVGRHVAHRIRTTPSPASQPVVTPQSPTADSAGAIVAAAEAGFSQVARQIAIDLAAAVGSEQEVRVYVFDFVDDTDLPTAQTQLLAEEVRVEIVNSGGNLRALERDILDVAVEETQYYNYLLGNEPEKLGELALFAPADIVLYGRLAAAAGIERLFVRAFNTSDGVIRYASAYSIDLGGER